MAVDWAKQGKSALVAVLVLALGFPFPLWAGQPSDSSPSAMENHQLRSDSEKDERRRLAQRRKPRSTKVQSIGVSPKAAPEKAPAAPATPRPKKKALYGGKLEKQVILLDVSVPSKYYKIRKDLYEAVLLQLEEAEQLGAVTSRKAAGRGAKIRNILRSCNGIKNTACLMKYARKSKSAYAVVGDIIDSDDLGVLVLWLYDVRTGEQLSEIRRPLFDPTKILETAEEGTCQLTAAFGCEPESPPPVVAVAPVGPIGDDQGGQESDVSSQPVVRSQPSSPSSSSPYKPWAWTATGVSIAALVGGSVMLGLAFSSYNDYLDAKTPAEARSKKSDVDTYSIVSYSLFGLSAAALGTGIALFVLDSQHSPGTKVSDVTVVPAANPTGGGFVVQGRF